MRFSNLEEAWDLWVTYGGRVDLFVQIKVDYAHFGDVVAFDTTFGTNKEKRPIGIVQTPFSLPEKYAYVTGLKKKQSQNGGSKRKRTWIDKYHKTKKNKANNPTVQEGNGSQVIQSETHEGNLGTSIDTHQEYESIRTYTQLLTNPNSLEDYQFSALL
ncbi:hypothetical protein ACP70R_044615 [Stipagrostis hirtigluma subsp. patula]